MDQAQSAKAVQRMREGHYYDRDGHPISSQRAGELLTDIDSRLVAEDSLVDETIAARVSTVFLVLDHNWQDDGPPVLYETMVFYDLPSGTAMGNERWHYRTWAEARTGHKQVVADLVSKGFVRKP